MRILRLFPLLMIILLAATAAHAQNDPSVPALPLNAEGIPVVARVNEQEITLPQLQRAVTRYEQQALATETPEVVQQRVLAMLIEQALINQAATAQQVAVTDDEVQAEITANVELAGGEDAWRTWLDANLFTEDEYRQVVRDTLTAIRLRDLITADVSAELPQVHARHILVATEAEANAVLQRLQGGEDFAALAAELSVDVTTREAGGDLGWFAREELLEPVLADVAFSLEPGTIAGPVPTGLGFHIIQTIEREERTVEEERRPAIAQARFEAWIAELYTGATIEQFLTA